MAGYDYEDDLDGDLDVPTSGGSLGRALLWLLSLGLLVVGVWQAQTLYQVAYGTIPGEFLGSGENQLDVEEAIVNEPSSYVYKRPDANSEVLFSARAGTRFQLLGREGMFLKLPLPGNEVGYLPLRAATPGFLFIKDEAQRLRFERRYFPKRFTKVTNSLWEETGRGRSQLAVEVENSSNVAIDQVAIQILFQDEDGVTQHTMDLMLEGRIEGGTRRSFDEIPIDLEGRYFPRSEIVVHDVWVAPDIQAL